MMLMNVLVLAQGVLIEHKVLNVPAIQMEMVYLLMNSLIVMNLCLCICLVNSLAMVGKCFMGHMFILIPTTITCLNIKKSKICYLNGANERKHIGLNFIC